MNINTNDLSFINFNNQKMQWIRFNNKLIYENWERLSKGGVPPITLPKCKGKILALPNEYQQVEYIENTGTQYIDTEVTDSTNTKVVLDFAYMGVSNPGGSSYMGSNGGNLIAVNTSYKFAIGGYASDITPIVDERYTIILNRDLEGTRKLQINSSEEYVGSKASQSNNIYLCALGGSPTSGKILAKMYSCKIYKDSVLIRNMLPCYRKSDNIIGMYDLVNNVFYTNIGTGEFLKGRDINTKVNLIDYKIYGNSKQKTLLPSEYQEVEYVESTGTQYIEIDYIATEITNSKGKYQITDTTKANMMFGSRNSSTAPPSYGFNWGGGIPYRYYNTYYGHSQDGITNMSIDEEIHTFEKRRHQLYIDDELIHTRLDTDGTIEFTTPYKMVVFGCNTKGAIGLFTYVKLFNLQFYDDDELKIDLIPCYRKLDNVIGLYDLVENKFYTNNGTGTFLKGNDVLPSPNNPVEIQSVGDKSTNILNPDFSKTNAVTYSYILLSDTPKVLTLRLIDRDTSVDITNVSFGFTGNGANANDDFHWCVAGGGIRDRFITNNTNNGDNSIENPLMYFSVYPKSQATWEAVFKRFYIQIVEGEYTEATIPEYEPYGYKIPVKVRGINLCNSSEVTIGGIAGANGHDYVNPKQVRTGYIEVEPNTNYYLEIDKNLMSKCTAFFYDKDKIRLSMVTINETTKIFTSHVDAAYLRLRINNPSDLDYTDEEFKSIKSKLFVCKQIELGDYSPYYEPIITNIYAKQPLRKNENYVDYTDYKEQKIFRNIDNVMFDGTENWEIHTSIDGGNVFRLDNVLNPLTNAPMSSTHMSHFNLTNIYSTAKFDINTYRLSSNQEVDKITGNRLYIATEHATLEEFKSWLAENKPSITYPTPTNTEIIELPLVPVNRGTNIIEINTEIQPSNMEITYWGKAIES